MQKSNRNDLCPCGSGKKYKKCCLLKTKTYDLNIFYIKFFAVILIFFLGTVVYSNSFHCSFHLDDASSITYNSAIKNIGDLPSIWNFLPRRFLLYLSLALNYHFNGLDVLGYHLVNLAVHLVSAILVWWLTLLILSSPALRENKITQHANLVALFAGLIFVSHPIQTEAVTYIVQRAASMATMFYLASVCLYVSARGPSASGKFYYIGSLLMAIAAMFTKETAITLPLTILLYEFYFLKTDKHFNWKYTLPFLFTILIIPVIMLLTETGAARIQELYREPGISSTHYLLTQFRVIVTYIRLAFLPINQNFDYDYSVSKSLFEFPTLISFLFLMAILATASRLFKNYRLISFSLFWFFLTLLPESSFLPIKDVIFEHRVYLPLAGYSIFLVSCVYYLIGKNAISAMVIILTAIVTVNSFLTFQRNKVWESDLILLDDTIKKSPYKARPYNNRGFIYYNQGNFNQAIADFNKAIEIDPKDDAAFNNRGLNHDKLRDFNQAIADYDQAIELNPKYVEAYTNRGNTYDNKGDFARAIADYDHSIKLNPQYAEAYTNRGNAYAKQGKIIQAISDYDKAIEIDPDYSECYCARGVVYAKQNNFTQAMSDYSKSIELDPSNAQTYYNRAVSYYQLKQYDEAWQDVQKAKELGAAINPKFISALRQVSGQQN